MGGRASGHPMGISHHSPKVDGRVALRHDLRHRGCHPAGGGTPDITDNPLGILFTEVEAAMVPNVLADVDYGIIRSIRGYNLLALIYAVLCMLEMILTASPYSIIWTVIVDVLICVILLIFIPVLEKGVKKWTT